jgi:hypothetical protein
METMLGRKNGPEIAPSKNRTAGSRCAMSIKDKSNPRQRFRGWDQLGGIE